MKLKLLINQALIKRVNMNLEKLKDVETEFLPQYPSGFQDAKFSQQWKNLTLQNSKLFYKRKLKKNFLNPNLVSWCFFQIIQKSVLVSLFDKLKFRDMLAGLILMKRYVEYWAFELLNMEIKKWIWF